MALRDFFNRILGRRENMPDRNATIQAVPQPFASVELTSQTLLNDDSVYTVYNIFTDILLGSGWTWEGKDVSKVKDQLDLLPLVPGWAQMLDALAKVPFQRYTPIEIIWDTRGGWKPVKYRELPVAACSLDLDAMQEVELVHVTTTAGLQNLPPQNAIVHRYRPTFQFPLGQSVHDHLKEVIDYKRRADSASIRILERFAGASLVGWYAPNSTKESQRQLLSALKTLQSASVGVLPGPKGDAGNSIDMLELKSSAGLTFALDLLKMYERRIARAVLGSVLAVFESEYGTRAQSETHLKILSSVVEGYQEDVEEPINAQLIKPYLRYNVDGGEDLDVRWVLNAPDFTDQSKTGQWIDGLLAAGVLDAESEEDNNIIRNLFGVKMRDWKKRPEVKPEDRLPDGENGMPPKLPPVKIQSEDNPKVA